MGHDDQQGGHGHLLDQTRPLLFRDETKVDQGVASTITDRKCGHVTNPTTGGQCGLACSDLAEPARDVRDLDTRLIERDERRMDSLHRRSRPEGERLVR